VPIVIEGIPLTLTQARVLAATVERHIEAKHDKETAVAKAVEVFRETYRLDGDQWVANRSVKLARHGGEIRNKYYVQDKKERQMAKTDEAKKDSQRSMSETMRVIREAGARNSRGDKERLSGALDALINVLNKRDQEDVLRSLGKRLGGRVSFKREEQPDE
jgi:hypothetical protein